jgi:hypothetical protein
MAGLPRGRCAATVKPPLAIPDCGLNFARLNFAPAVRRGISQQLREFGFISEVLV